MRVTLFSYRSEIVERKVMSEELIFRVLNLAGAVRGEAVMNGQVYIARLFFDDSLHSYQ